jgi:hypothetical protein
MIALTKNCWIVTTLSSLALLLNACSSGERVIKPTSLVAKKLEGDYEVQTFLINGTAAAEAPSSFIPDSELKIDLTFFRFAEVQSPSFVIASIVFERKETEKYAKGSQTVVTQKQIETRGGKGQRSVSFSVQVPTAQQADFAESSCMGRYFLLIVSEKGSEITSKKLGLDRTD